MDSDGEIIKHVYAVYGLTLNNSQLIEASLVMLMAAGFLKMPQNMTRQMYDRRLIEYQKKTFGQLEKEWSQTHSDVAFNGRLKAAVKARNFLAHRFFNERAAQFMIPKGREAMLTELEQYDSEFRAIDEQITELQIAYSTRMGVSRNDVAIARAEMLREAAKAYQSN
jgi:hypothetical protein